MATQEVLAVKNSAHINFMPIIHMLCVGTSVVASGVAHSSGRQLWSHHGTGEWIQQKQPAHWVRTGHMQRVWTYLNPHDCHTTCARNSMRCDNSLATQALQDIRPHLTAMTYNKAHILWHNPQCTTGATVNSPLAPYVQVRTWAPKCEPFVP